MYSRLVWVMTCDNDCVSLIHEDVSETYLQFKVGMGSEYGKWVWKVGMGSEYGK